jgi:hypothetical protein
VPTLCGCDEWRCRRSICSLSEPACEPVPPVSSTRCRRSRPGERSAGERGEPMTRGDARGESRGDIAVRCSAAAAAIAAAAVSPAPLSSIQLSLAIIWRTCSMRRRTRLAWFSHCSYS